MTISTAPAAPAAEFTPEQLDLHDRARRFVEERADPQRGAGRARRREDPRRAQAAHQERGDRRAPVGRAPRPRARRPGLDEDRVVPRRGAARPLDERALLAHAGRVQRAAPAARRSRSSATSSPRCAASCTTPTRSPRPRPAPTRRASRPPPRKTDSGWVIDGEKWFVTYGDVAAVYIVMANAQVDGASAADAVPDRPLGRRHRDRRRPALLAHLSARPPDDPLHERRGGRRRGDRRARRRRGPAARLVHRGAARDRRARRRLDVAADRGRHRLGARARAGRQPDHGLPGRVVPAGGLRRGRRRRAPAGARGGAARRLRAPTRRSSTPRPRWRSCS